ncbi:LamG domain-containing protein, partial [Anaerobaca lacustris]|nr:LamG domain-containing protein [Sedimentisphaerales bacterium M17dextr]
MWQRCTCIISLVVLLALIQGGAAFGAWNFLEDPALIGWWACDEGEGALVADSSPNGNDGAVVNGDPVWAEGAYGSAVTLVGPTLVEIQPMDLTLSEATMAGWLFAPTAQPEWSAIIMHRNPGPASGFNLLGDQQLAYHWNDASSTWSFRPQVFHPLDEWAHCAVTVEPDKATFYLNGVASAVNAVEHPSIIWDGFTYLGGDGNEQWVGRRMNGGSLDDVCFFSRALSEDEIQTIMGGPGAAGLAKWENAAAAAEPTFSATNVEDGLYDIGELSGDISYEFIVQSNPDETQASMCLIGRRDFGDVQAGLKFEQWNNTGTYGATIFGVADYDFGVANDPGVVTHLVFISNADLGVTDLYVNGAYRGSVPTAITLSGVVGIGYGAQDREGADPFFDDFDGEIFGVAVYDRALTLGEIRTNVDAYFLRGPSDITTPGDAILGVPNDGDWPGAETPDLAIDNNVATKYLHFKGETEPTGFQVTPMLGSTLVTGLTFTTANDAPERDPIAFELYGSNESIEGPYELIAAGEIADFNQVDAWPRFTMNATPIEFENTAAYEHYQILFPAVRNPAAANSMQIAEVELIGVPAVAAKPLIVWVSFHEADDTPSGGAAGAGFTEAADKAYTDLLQAAGYDVVRYIQTGTPDLDVVNAADLVIISRSVASGSFANDAATTWNNVSAPMMILGGYVIRQNRMGFATGNTIPDTIGDIMLTAIDPEHPVFAGIALTDGIMDNPFAGVVTYADGTLARGISIVTDLMDDEATILGTVSAASGDVPAGAVVIAEWPAGATLTHAGGAGTDVLAGPRLVFLTGAREASGISSETAGMFDLYEDGAQMFLNAVAYMLIEPE